MHYISVAQQNMWQQSSDNFVMQVQQAIPTQVMSSSSYAQAQQPVQYVQHQQFVINSHVQYEGISYIKTQNIA